MKIKTIRNVEAVLSAAFRADKDLHPAPEWSKMVMTAVRNVHAVGTMPVTIPEMPFKMMWRLAMGSAAAALICVMLYMAFPAQNSSSVTTVEVPLSSFENAITAIAQR